MSTDNLPLIAFLIILFLAVYMLPTVIAAVRGHPNVMPIAIVNFFFRLDCNWLRRLSCVVVYRNRPEALAGPQSVGAVAGRQLRHIR